ncbi:hypothetical protein B0H16DRAFT_1614631 [Mycena metata]|uniref:Uncharacterized protein n=1 Tax=Mycena metata TaxID=1033252 RepID=A0AAD7MH74_9AGAR|nr:hypothetical protein B0H16DRAFT_1614631 [Mycena metata]
MPLRNNRIDFTSPLIEHPGNIIQCVNPFDRSPFISCQDNNCTASFHAPSPWTNALLVALCPHLSDCPNLTSTLDADNATLQPIPEGSHYSAFQMPTSNGTTSPHSLKIVIPKSVHLHYFNWTSTVHSPVDIQIPSSDPAFKPGIEGGSLQVTFSFVGDRVELYGGIGDNGGSYDVELDGKPCGGQPCNRTTKSHTSLPDQLIFYTDSLPLESHNVTVSGTFNLTYAIVDGTLNNLTSAPPPSASSSLSVISSTNSAHWHPPSHNSISDDQSPKHSGLSQAQLIGIMAAVAFLVTLMVLALGHIFWRRYRRRVNLKARSFDGFPTRPSTPPPVQTVPEIPSISFPENPPTRFYEPDWTNSVYSQTTTVALDQGYSNYLKGTREAKAHSSADSLGSGSEGVLSRRESADGDSEYVVNHPIDMGVYAV